MEIKATEVPDLGSIVLHLRHACTEGRPKRTFPNKKLAKGAKKFNFPSVRTRNDSKKRHMNV